MSLLEDVFLQDEANEAQELERVIEGDEFEERRRSDSDDNDEKEDEAEEDKRRIDPTKPKTTRVVKNPRFLLNPARLTGPRGIQVIPNHFKDFKFKGKGCEKEDLDIILKRLEHWAYRLYPKFQFEDCLKKIEMLGKKRPVAVHLHKIRSDQFLSEDIVEQKDSSDEDTPMPVEEEDEFDKLLQQQIELARSTPAPNSAKKPTYDGSASPNDKRTTSLLMPKATSSPSINDEQRERMMRSRKLAEERRTARMKNAVNTDSIEVSCDSRLIGTNKNPKGDYDEIIESGKAQTERMNEDTDELAINKKHNRSNVIDSSDEETAIETCVSVAIDVHTNKITDENDVGENEKSHNSINGNTHLYGKETKDVENEIRSENTNNSKSDINEGNELIADNEDMIQEEINMSHTNGRQDNANLKFHAYVNEKSDENDELNDNSDMNIVKDKGRKESNISDKNNEDIMTSENDREEKKRFLNDIDYHENAIITTEETSNIELEKSSAPNEINVVNKEIDKTNIVSNEIIEDVMDVDFTDDF